MGHPVGHTVDKLFFFLSLFCSVVSRGLRPACHWSKICQPFWNGQKLGYKPYGLQVVALYFTPKKFPTKFNVTKHIFLYVHQIWTLTTKFPYSVCPRSLVHFYVASQRKKMDWTSQTYSIHGSIIWSRLNLCIMYVKYVHYD